MTTVAVAGEDCRERTMVAGGERWERKDAADGGREERERGEEKNKIKKGKIRI